MNGVLIRSCVYQMLIMQSLRLNMIIRWSSNTFFRVQMSRQSNIIDYWRDQFKFRFGSWGHLVLFVFKLFSLHAKSTLIDFRSANMKQHQKKSGKSNASFGQHHIIQELSKLQIIVISIYLLGRSLRAFIKITKCWFLLSIWNLK
jgi:cell division protein FtsI/penicillin-binding protein 2